MKRLALLLVALSAALAGACGGSDDDSSGGASARAPAPQLADVTSVDQLRERFNADQGAPRLIVLVAPT